MSSPPWGVSNTRRFTTGDTCTTRRSNSFEILRIDGTCTTRTITTGARPQLARFPADSNAWLHPDYQRFAPSRLGTHNQTDHDPIKTANVAQIDFYVDGLLKTRQVSDRQSGGQNYRGLMSVHPYQQPSSYVLYATGDHEVYVGTAQYAKNASGIVRRFVMGDDGRFHLESGYRKTIYMHSDGYLYYGQAPSNPRSLNGVFRYDGTHLIHLEDGKYMSVPRYGSAPYVDAGDQGNRSTWYMTDPNGKLVTPPASNRNAYWNDKLGDRETLYAFDQDADSALPPGTTHFVTKVPHGVVARYPNPGDSRASIFADYFGFPQTYEGIDKVIGWLARDHAAWLFRDGYYLFATSPDKLEVRTIGGKPVWEATLDRQRKWLVTTKPDLVKETFRILDNVWRDILDREDQSEGVEAGLFRHR